MDFSTSDNLFDRSRFSALSRSASSLGNTVGLLSLLNTFELIFDLVSNALDYDSIYDLSVYASTSFTPEYTLVAGPPAALDASSFSGIAMYLECNS